ncbi:MAG: hypothetical protein K5657_05555 [Desulfovibrio sp.]|nr:hypothetical protein [Desulfovibrio sp.]
MLFVVPLLVSLFFPHLVFSGASFAASAKETADGNAVQQKTSGAPLQINGGPANPGRGQNGMKTSLPGDMNAKTAAPSKPYEPPLPEIFGVSLKTPKKLEKRLLDLGYACDDWALDPPFSRKRYTLSDNSAVFKEIELFLCNHPQVLARLRIRGKGDVERFYGAVRDRFHFSLSNAEFDEGADRRHPRYIGYFAEKCRVTLSNDRQGTLLLIECEEAVSACRSAHEHDFKHLLEEEKTAKETKKDLRRNQF